MATITGNSVYADPTQWFTLDYTFSNSKFTWSVYAKMSGSGSVWNNIYGLTVNVGGNSYYKGDINAYSYTPNSATPIYGGETDLTDCTISGGNVTISFQGNFFYGTWNTSYQSSGSGDCPVNPPTYDALSWSATKMYSTKVVANRSKITFTVKGTSQTGSDSMSYALYQGSTVIGTTTGSSGTAKTITITAPSAGTYTYKYMVSDGNGLSSTSGTVSITTYAYTPPSFTSVSAVRWTTGNSSGTASDEGKYCKATATFTKGKIGSTSLTTTMTVSTSSPSHSDSTTASGTALYLGNNDYSPDDTYIVTFKVTDAYATSISLSPVTLNDTLTQGGRGLDFVYNGGEYGIGISVKATAGYFDVGLDTRITDGINNAELTALPTSQTSLISRTSGLAISASSVHTWGRLAMASLTLTTTATSYTAGAEIFRGSVSTYLPIAVATAGGFWNNTAYRGISGRINTDGTILVKVDNATTFTTSSINISWIYLF